MTTAVFGGSFDPPHVGHVLGAAYALAVGGFDRILVVPVYRHAFVSPAGPLAAGDKGRTPFEHRVAMARLAFAPLPAVEVSELEAELPAPSYTLTTLQALRARSPEDSLRLLVGSDILGETHLWHAWEEVCRLAPPWVLPRGRSGGPDANRALLPVVSSTEIRALLAGHEDGRARLAELVPAAVLAYLGAHGLYR